MEHVDMTYTQRQVREYLTVYYTSGEFRVVTSTDHFIKISIDRKILPRIIFPLFL